MNFWHLNNEILFGHASPNSFFWVKVFLHIFLFRITYCSTLIDTIICYIIIFSSFLSVFYFSNIDSMKYRMLCFSQYWQKFILCPSKSNKLNQFWWFNNEKVKYILNFCFTSCILDYIITNRRIPRL